MTTAAGDHARYNGADHLDGTKHVGLKQTATPNLNLRSERYIDVLGAGTVASIEPWPRRGVVNQNLLIRDTPPVRDVC